MEPYFFQKSLSAHSEIEILDEATSKHCIQVLRMQQGSRIRLTNGRGLLSIAEIVTQDKKRCSVRVTELMETNPSGPTGFSIGIAFTKNRSRNEWLLEKLTEMGTEHIYPILTEHGEKEKFNEERYEKILISSMLQSQQTFLPCLHPVQKFSNFLMQTVGTFKGQIFLAHCGEGEEKKSFSSVLQKGEKCLILIGPEGDFSPEEVQQSFQSGLIPVHLGNTRLRTETAGMYACAVYNAFQNA